jgi:hypothetical protein
LPFYYWFWNAYSEKENVQTLENHWTFFVFHLLASYFLWSALQRTGCFKRSLRISDHGFSECDYRRLGLWLVLVASIALYFILEFNLRPSSVKAKLNDINENTIGKVKSMMPSSDENFEADEELERRGR